MVGGVLGGVGGVGCKAQPGLSTLWKPGMDRLTWHLHRGAVPPPHLPPGEMGRVRGQMCFFIQKKKKKERKKYGCNGEFSISF